MGTSVSPRLPASSRLRTHPGVYGAPKRWAAVLRTDQRGVAMPCPAVMDYRYAPNAPPREKKRLEAGEKGAWKSPGTCMRARCRTCWTCPDIPVTYGDH